MRILKKIKNFILHHRSAFTALILIIGLTSIVFLPKIILIHDKVSESNNTLTPIEVLAHSAEFVSAIYLMLGTVIAVWQYYVSSQKHIEQIQREQIQKAIDLAGYYKDNILYKYTPIKLAYKKSGLLEVLDKIPKQKIKDFDSFELKKLLSEQDIENYNNIIKSSEFFKAIYEVNQILGLNLKGCKTKEMNEDLPDGNNKVKIEIDTAQFINDFYKNYVTSILNDAELFAMYFTHGIADESVIYQSIYPTYLELCNTLYYEIARCSAPGKAKLYTNVKKLYGQWKEKFEKQNEEFENNLRNTHNDCGTIAETEKLY